MIYRECGHIIKSCDVDRAPKCVREKDMPKKCFACRGAARVEELKLRDKKKPGQERGRQGLGLGPRIYLPRVLGGLRRNAVTAVDWNIDEFRRDWRAEIDAIFGNVEQDRRDQW